ncbi:hypothetical protein CCR75_002348 [Bremia lactucae]|uniref:Vesicle transport protein n=1 Tax=Bremia lactucae TaxID=4779 RepID=A0A976FNT5_BRELC|nr:hypothetical protein CCR75_002348 [Bremia lactucae]
MSAWEQWGGKKPTGGGLLGAQEAFQSLLRSVPLSAASNASTNGKGSTASATLQQIWDSARDLTKHAVTTPRNIETDVAIDNLETGQSENVVHDGSFATWLLGGRHANSKSGLVLTMSWATRFKYFVGMAMLGMLFFAMASIFLPLIMIRPSKFALSFTLGSVCCMSALAMLKGPAAYMKGIMQPDRLLLTSAYIVTLGCTLYSCLILGNYMLVVLSSVMQLLTLGLVAFSAFPGGQSSLKGDSKLFWM